MHLWHLFFVPYLNLNDFVGQRVHRVRIVHDWHGKMRRMFWSALPMFLLARDGWHWMGTYRAVDHCIWVCISPNDTAYVGMAKCVPHCMDTWPNRLRLHDSSSLRFALIATEWKKCTVFNQCIQWQLKNVLCLTLVLLTVWFSRWNSEFLPSD